MNSRELKQQLTSRGCEFIRQGKGSHEIWRNKDGKTTAIPHPKNKIGKGLLQKLLKWAD